MLRPYDVMFNGLKIKKMCEVKKVRIQGEFTFEQEVSVHYLQDRNLFSFLIGHHAETSIMLFQLQSGTMEPRWWTQLTATILLRSA